MLDRASEAAGPRTERTTQKVVVINGSREMLDLLESVLGGAGCDAVFVADTGHAYSQVKQHRPNLVVLCLSLDDPFGFQVLSMLKVDEETARIPVLTYASGLDADGASRPSDAEAEAEEEDLSMEALDPPMH